MRKRKATVFALVVLLLASCISAASPKAVMVSAATKEAKAINYTKKTVEVSKKFTLKVNNAEKTDKITYKSANKAIATVSSKGVVTGVSTGKTTITATLTDKSKKTQTFKCTVTVKELYVPNITDVKLVKDGDLILDSKPSIKVSYCVDKATTAEIEVYNLMDELIYTKKANVKKNKVATFTWNCKDMDGELVDEDTYYFKILADTAEANSDSFRTYETSDFEKGTGSEKNPYGIKTAEQFKMMVAHNGCSFYLMNDIDMEYGSLSGLFSKDAPFNGTLDGKGHTLKNISNTASIITTVGENGVIKNLNIDNISKTSGECGILVNLNYGLIENCKITKGNSGTDAVGFIALDNYGVIKKCEVSGKIAGEAANTGGIVHENKDTGKILNCKSSVDIMTHWSYISYRGGIAAWNKGLIASCSSSSENLGVLDSYYVRPGAIVGNNSGVVQSCFYTGTQSGLNLVGEGTPAVD